MQTIAIDSYQVNTNDNYAYFVCVVLHFSFTLYHFNVCISLIYLFPYIMCSILMYDVYYIFYSMFTFPINCILVFSFEKYFYFLIYKMYCTNNLYSSAQQPSCYTHFGIGSSTLSNLFVMFIIVSFAFVIFVSCMMMNLTIILKVLVHGSAEATDHLKQHCLKNVCPHVYAPQIEEIIDVTSDLCAYKVQWHQILYIFRKNCTTCQN